jgi:inorganic pyrophosphatase
MKNNFWSKLDALLASHPIIIDRPKGKPHPRYPEVIYPLDYGYLEGTTSGDGEGIDIWLGSLESERRIVGAVVTLDTLKYDLEVKLLINCSEEEIQIIMNFFAENHMGAKLMRRD